MKILLRPSCFVLSCWWYIAVIRWNSQYILSNSIIWFGFLCIMPSCAIPILFITYWTIFFLSLPPFPSDLRCFEKSQRAHVIDLRWWYLIHSLHWLRRRDWSIVRRVFFEARFPSRVMACSKSGLTNTNTRSICCFVASTRKKKHYTTTFPKPCPKLNMSLGKTRSTAYESCTLKENRTELYCPFRRIFLSGLTLICCHQSAAIASTLQSGQVGNQSSVRSKGKE